MTKENHEAVERIDRNTLGFRNGCFDKKPKTFFFFGNESGKIGHAEHEPTIRLALSLR